MTSPLTSPSPIRLSRPLFLTAEAIWNGRQLVCIHLETTQEPRGAMIKVAALMTSVFCLMFLIINQISNRVQRQSDSNRLFFQFSSVCILSFSLTTFLSIQMGMTQFKRTTLIVSAIGGSTLLIISGVIGILKKHFVDQVPLVF